ncbi:orotate phosphoribosyltransferase [Lachnospiraceae bacterium KGMB03038]|nr:orotate phosphoribosyltransferase [Lachnospiraceae bacterium KGMB03038]
MDGRFEDLRSVRNPKARIKIMKGHFATSNSHLNTYIDMSTIKTRHNNARETAKELAGEYLANTFVNTIVCLDETEVIGTFLAEQLADSSQLSLSAGNNISVVTPEYTPFGQIMFRDNKQRMVKNQQVLILAASVTTGKTINRAIESILYYGGTICGICAIFSAVTKIAGMDIKTIFTSKDVPDYRAYEAGNCPMCQEGGRVEALVNSFGYSKLE